VGNGDVFTPADAERMFRETGVDGVMLGRGVLGDPWLIRKCSDRLSGHAPVEVTPQDKADFIIKLLERIHLETPAPVALGKMKKMGDYLTKGIYGGAHLRGQMHAARTCLELQEITREFLLAVRSQKPEEKKPE
jgi:tRNA-dihydrouridine synthase